MSRSSPGTRLVLEIRVHVCYCFGVCVILKFTEENVFFNAVVTEIARPLERNHSKGCENSRQRRQFRH